MSRLLESFNDSPLNRIVRVNEIDMLTDLVAFIVQLYADEVSLSFSRFLLVGSPRFSGSFGSSICIHSS